MTWWKWVLAVLLSPLSILWGCVVAVWKEVICYIPAAYRQLWHERPWRRR